MRFDAPEIVNQIKEIGFIYDRSDKTAEDLDQALRIIENDIFLSSSSEKRVEELEELLKLPNQESYSLEVRRDRIKSKMFQKLPYSYRILKNSLIALCGEEMFEMSIDNETEELTFRLHLGRKKLLKEAEKLMDNMTPLNIVLKLSLIYNTQNTIRYFTHAELSKFKHAELREEVINERNKEL